MFKATPEELELIADILTFTGTEASRILPTETAIDVFERSDLTRNDLKEIWRFADKDRNGMLTSKELAVALRLIGWVQAGEELAEHLIELPGPLPTLKGISDVQKTQGPPVVPDQLSPRPPHRSPLHSRSPSLPFFGRAGHTPTHSTGSLPAPSTSQTPLPSTPPSAKSEPSVPLSPLDNDDLTTPILGFPPASLHNLTFLTSPTRSVRGHRRAQTADQAERLPYPQPQLLGYCQSSLRPPELPTPPPTADSRWNNPPSESSPQPSHSATDDAATITTAQTLSPNSAYVMISAHDEVPFEEADSAQRAEVVVDAEPEPSSVVGDPPMPAPAPPEAPDENAAYQEEIKRLEQLLGASERKTLVLESRLVEQEAMTSQVLSAQDDELKARLTRTTARIVELEGFEKESRETAALVETLTRDLHELKTEKETLRTEMQQKLDAKEKEIIDLEKRASEMAEERQTLERQHSAAVQRLTAESLRLTHRLEEKEQAFAREKGEWSKRVQEVEAIAAELQWSEGASEMGLQRALQDATMANDTLKSELQDLRTQLAQQQQERVQHEVEASRLQRQLAELRRENARTVMASGQVIELESGSTPRHTTRVPEIQSEHPPPAYDDAVFV